MKETAIQAIVCDVVNEAGGFAMKMDNAFVGGVADLLIKLPNYRQFKGWRGRGDAASFLEVKQRVRPRTGNATFSLDVTHLQDKFLRRADAAGIPCGVASFMQEGTGSGLKLWLHVMTWRVASYEDGVGAKAYTTCPDAHILLGRKGEREGPLLSALYDWHQKWREER